MYVCVYVCIYIYIYIYIYMYVYIYGIWYVDGWICLEYVWVTGVEVGWFEILHFGAVAKPPLHKPPLAKA